jgi:hypothetical protein
VSKKSHKQTVAYFRRISEIFLRKSFEIQILVVFSENFKKILAGQLFFQSVILLSVSHIFGR